MTKRIVCITANRAFGGRDIPNGYRVARALAAAGHDVSVMDHPAVTPAALIGSDLVLAFGTVVSDEHKTPGIVDRLRRAVPPSAVLALWYFDYCHPSLRNAPWKHPVMRRVVPRFDFVATTDHSWPWESIAPRYMHLTQGVDPADFDGTVAAPEVRRHDFIYTGGNHTGFEYRERQLKRLSARWRGMIIGRGRWDRVYGPRFFRAYQTARIAFVPGPPPECGGHYWSNRIYLATATGTPCLVGWCPGIDDHFVGDSVVVYYHDDDDMMRRAAELIGDPFRRSRIGAAGRERTLTTHTYRKRTDDLMEAIWPTNRK